MKIFPDDVICDHLHYHKQHSHSRAAQRKIVKKNNNNTAEGGQTFSRYKMLEHGVKFWYCCSNRCRVNTLAVFVSGEEKREILIAS